MSDAEMRPPVEVPADALGALRAAWEGWEDSTVSDQMLLESLSEFMFAAETMHDCGLCKEPAQGLASIGEQRYCHEGPSPTCYEVVQWRQRDTSWDEYLRTDPRISGGHVSIPAETGFLINSDNDD